MKPILVALLLFLVAGCLPTHAELFDNWSAEQWWYQGAYTALAVTDWAQSDYLLDRSDGALSDQVSEANPALGRRPNREKLRNAVAIGILAHLLVSDLLSPVWRERWQLVWIGIEAHAVYRNWRIGTIVSF
jgi:hypothetical protein